MSNHKDFLLYTNGETMDYDAFYKVHEKVYPTEVQYHVKYDEETFLEEGQSRGGPKGGGSRVDHNLHARREAQRDQFCAWYFSYSY